MFLLPSVWSSMRRFCRDHPGTGLMLCWSMLLLIDLLLVRDIEWTRENITGTRFVVNFILSGLAYWGLLFNIRGLLLRRRRIALTLLSLFLVAYLAQTSYFEIYRKFITTFDVRFFFSDPLLSLALWREHVGLLVPLLTTLLAMLVLVLVMSVEYRPRGWGRWGSGLLAAGLFGLVSLNWYGAPYFQVAPVAYYSSLAGAVDLQLGELAGPQRPALAPRHARAGAPNIIFVIGESLNRDHLGVYGYARDTTPGLSALQARGELLAMRNAVSVSPRTLTSVPYMLTGLEGIDPHGAVFRVPTLFNYAKSAGYRTGLVTAQDFRWRGLDQMLVDKDLDHFRQGVDFSADVSVSIGADDQQVLERGLLPFIAEAAATGKPYLLVAQMSGSHTPFSRQVPAASKVYLPEEGPNSVNAYDNTVRYTDRYLARLVAEARAADANTWVFYSSDHGEHVAGEKSQFHHDFRPEVIRNPLLIFPPQGRGEAVRVNLDAPVTHADIVPTALELMGVVPVTELDGVSLLQPVDRNRLRIVTAFMITLHKDPRAALVFPDQSIFEIDFERGNVKLSDGETLVRYDQLDERYRRLFERRLQLPGEDNAE
ncbi:hypothetical protein GCM10011348_19450 [Marinobacterium nitratireducens]|uniref:Sulfatase N-terminal domain-containing protein n=1 Tax=Marinobacterium nitratireducens TaxID=518897 RepID=A0A917ZFG3_9GAMM|nr:phosphoethanolamine transferase [Marinobacterium nitratireducens]GGO81124.1 hypothetical protein GCM10011348_19450 [Marinobacterium nitratireducens]